jgi:acylphosphatase
VPRVVVLGVGRGRHAVEVVRYRVTVFGRVQGVWYRESCRRVADEAGVAGWVRNSGDGTVEAVLEGERPAVDHVVSWMRGGPPRAAVTGVDVEAESPQGERGFKVG